MRVRFFVAIGLAISTISISVEAGTCFTHAELIQQEVESLHETPACDAIGKAYVMGVTGVPAVFEDVSPLEGYVYYFEIRFFLAQETYWNSVEKTKSAYIHLLIASMIMNDTPGIFIDVPSRVSLQREKYYKAYLLIKYWELNPLNDSNIPRLTDVLELLLDETPLSGQQLSCFVEADIPTLPVEQIFQSAQYTACISKE